LTILSCNQTDIERSQLGETYARRELQNTLSDTTGHNLIGKNILVIKDKDTAITSAETILFGIYGRERIIEQRPNEVYFIETSG